MLKAIKIIFHGQHLKSIGIHILIAALEMGRNATIVGLGIFTIIVGILITIWTDVSTDAISATRRSIVQSKVF